MNNKVTLGFFQLFRVLLGLYCITHFVALLPYGTELFSNSGILADKTLSPFYPFFPNVLFVVDTPLVVTALLGLGILWSALLILGKWEVVSAIGIWRISTSLFDRNPLIQNPSIPYLGWMLLAFAAVSFLNRRKREWSFPKELFLAAWVILALGYSYSGYTKLISPSWMDGTAIEEVLHNPLSRDNLIVNFVLGLGSLPLKLFTWSTLFLELFFAPLALFRVFRPWLWLSLLMMHVGLMSLIRFADLSLAMILFHLFTFDPGWIRSAKKREPLICFYDGECGLCHRFVRFVAQEGECNGLIRFAPLTGPLFASLNLKNVPDSLCCYIGSTERLYVYSSAVREVFLRIGGFWTLLGYMAYLFPQRFLDLFYRIIAKNRFRFFQKPSIACPLLESGWFATSS
ncbi:MAG: DCC1-like thiol-disulfide oxidoreductase family protein [Chlamydiia bacterium]